MLSPEDMHLKAEVMDRLAETSDDAIAAACRDMACQWRSLATQAVFMDAMMQAALADFAAPTDARPAGKA